MADTAWETGLAIAVAFIPVWLHHVAENIAARFGMPFLPGRFTQEVLMFSILNSPAGYVILHSKVRQFRRIGLVAAFQAPASIGVCGFLFVLSWLFYLDIAIAEGADRALFAWTLAGLSCLNLLWLEVRLTLVTVRLHNRLLLEPTFPFHP